MTGRAVTWTVAAAAAVIAAVGANGFAGGWNDGSRLATVESLVDRHTWAIDDSVFTRPDPYGPPTPHGTLDKLYINGHYYSDKSPVPAVLMAGAYAAWRAAGGPTAAERHSWFCRFMTLVTAGLAYVVAVVCIDAIARRAALPHWQRLTVAAGVAFGSLALPYSRSVNNHVLLMAVAAALLNELDRGAPAWHIGCLAGLAYTIDLGAGPVICLGAAALVAYRTRLSTQLLAFVAASTPWVVLHHALNYQIGGTLGPANANPAYFDWPGCPFNAGNITGAWNHATPWHFALYAADLLVGKKGFFGFNMALVMAVPATVVLSWVERERRPEVITCVGWMAATWLLYAATSRNYSGACVSVRWFVPLVAPGYYLVIRTLRARPDAGRPLLALTASAIVINVLAWWAGPWSGRMVPGYWLWVIAGLVCAWAVRDRPQPVAWDLRRAA